MDLIFYKSSVACICRGSTDSGIRSDDQLEVQDISDCESSSMMPSFSSMHSSRLQSRLNPVPESLNSPDIAPGKHISPGDISFWTCTLSYPDMSHIFAFLSPP